MFYFEFFEGFALGHYFWMLKELPYPKPFPFSNRPFLVLFPFRALLTAILLNYTTIMTNINFANY